MKPEDVVFPKEFFRLDDVGDIDVMEKRLVHGEEQLVHVRWILGCKGVRSILLHSREMYSLLSDLALIHSGYPYFTSAKYESFADIMENINNVLMSIKDKHDHLMRMDALKKKEEEL